MSRATDQIDEVLEDTITLYSLPEGSRAITTQNKDGSVDGEILIPIPRGTRVVDLASDVEEAFRTAEQTGALPTGVHYSFETRFEVGEQSEGKRTTDFQDVDGLKRAPTRYYSDPQSAVATIEAIDDELRKKRHRKASYLVVRVYWDRYGRKPHEEKW